MVVSLNSYADGTPQCIQTMTHQKSATTPVKLYKEFDIIGVQGKIPLRLFKKIVTFVRGFTYK
jgi:hypothetical protein